MMRFLRRLFTVCMIFILIWIAVNPGVIGTYLYSLLREPLPSEPPFESSFVISGPVKIPDQIDAVLIRDTIFQLTNDLRETQGVAPLDSNEILVQAADIRALETESSFSHTRPDERPFHSVLDGLYTYQMAGENLAMGTYHLPEAEMAAFLFNGWVESPGHYENMIEPGYTEMGVGVHYDGENLYLVQIFGTPF